MIKYNERHYTLIWWICFITTILGVHQTDAGNKSFGVFLMIAGIMAMGMLRVAYFVNMPYIRHMNLASVLIVVGGGSLILNEKIQRLIPWTNANQQVFELLVSALWGLIVGTIFASLFRVLFLKDIPDEITHE